MSMGSVDNFHRLSGHCPWTLSSPLVPIFQLDNVHGHSTDGVGRIGYGRDRVGSGRVGSGEVRRGGVGWGALWCGSV